MFPVAILLLTAVGYAAGRDEGYLGSEACAACHQQIAERHSRSYMARTWQKIPGPFFSAGYSERKLEGPAPPVEYLVASHEKGLTYQIQMPGRKPLSLPVEAAIGERRHGVSFLVRLRELEGTPLERAPLIAARHFHSMRAGALSLNPGFPTQKPESYETALGLVLSPSFEKRCLSCHGAPQYQGAGEGGVGCESCHGPGRRHTRAIAEQREDRAIVNPGKWTHAEVNTFCGRCHTGFEVVVDPRPLDLLISNQTTALELSECYIQSAGGFSCISCHDPHDNAEHDHQRSNSTCLSCHALEARKAGVCPVNAREDCVSCHMPPTSRPGVLPLVDHWIRVHPAAGEVAARSADLPRSHIRPRRVFLRMLVVSDPALAEALRRRLLGGEPFFELARQYSIDSSRSVGGFLGEMWLEKMHPALAGAAARLAPGAISEVIHRSGEFMVLQRMPRDFRWQAISLAEEAEHLAERDEFDQAVDRYQQALRIHPHFLKGLVSLGAVYGKMGETSRSVDLLEYAVRLFPKAPSAHFNLGIAYGLAERKDLEIQAYGRAIDLDPDLALAHVNLGLALVATGQLEEARRAFEQAVEINPLLVKARYNLGRLYELQGKTEAARRQLDLVARLQ